MTTKTPRMPLTDDKTLWDMHQIARELGVGYGNVQKWRAKEHLFFPGPIPVVLKPGTKPVLRWYAGQVRAWAIDNGRMFPDGTLPAGRTPDPASPLPPGTLTLEELVSDTEKWFLKDISRELGVQYQTVKIWRNEALKHRDAQGRYLPHPNRLPAPAWDGPNPWWYAGRVRQWAMQSGRMDEDGAPLRAKPPGRPKKATPLAAAPPEPAAVRPMMTFDELVGDRAIWLAEELHVELAVPSEMLRRWRNENGFPPPDLPSNVAPAWFAGTVRAWAIETGLMDRTGMPLHAKGRKAA